jgi:hypothetical protein
MAKSTIGTFLMIKSGTGSTWEKLIDIKDYPDLGGSPERMQSTTLSNKQHTYELGVQDIGEMQVTANYESEEYDRIKTYDDDEEHDFAFWFGGEESADGTMEPKGTDGKFSFKGKLTCYVSGGGVNEIRNIMISLSNSTDIVKETA